LLINHTLTGIPFDSVAHRQVKKDTFYDLYPLVFPTREPEQGFCCGNGWHQLLESLFEVIQKELSKLPEPTEFRILFIKEKWGELRVGYVNATERIIDTITQAEEMSGHICETCGEYGLLRDSAQWIKVRCNDCEKKQFAYQHEKLSAKGKAALIEGIRSAKADIEAGKPPIDLGSFAQYADDDD